MKMMMKKKLHLKNQLKHLKISENTLNNMVYTSKYQPALLKAVKYTKRILSISFSYADTAFQGMEKMTILKKTIKSGKKLKE